jgi:membrane dipeptidase
MPLKTPFKKQIILPTLVLGSSLLCSAWAVASSPIIASDKAKQLAQQHILIDTHIDVPYRINNKWEDVTQATESGDFDYPRARQGGLNAPFMSIYVPASLDKSAASTALADKLIDYVEAIVGRAPDKFAIATSTADIEAQFKQGLISLPMGMENGSPIQGDLANLQHFYQRGIRYITLAHSQSNHISDSSYDLRRQWKGLSPFGKELVVEMNKIGILVDISQNGGVIQINFGSTFVSKGARAWSDLFSSKRKVVEDQAGKDSEQAKEFAKAYTVENPLPYATLETVLDHIDHVVKLIGIDYVGIGSDYDGVGDTLPIGLKDVSSYPNLIQGLLDRGYSDADIIKIMGGNLLRVWKATEDYAASH